MCRDPWVLTIARNIETLALKKVGSPQKRKTPPLLAKPAAFRVSVHGAACGGDPRVTLRASRALTGRLLPESAILRGHVLENEITRHRITSFRFVEHVDMMGCVAANDKMPC
ncbi:hypothetical protein [Mesorhizobium sp. LNHC221B00]|uniref:hypothetical protein n=1 Tax=Mesorhizobium sp. LNHC221B00 TaxID=1287233 RepID=UPI0012EC2287|nr:hypothetical protein [Mesorhizobium sp. LNHC221B00]